ncbi:uncharacterized protein LY89DRAFT_714994 [Mollisia scopiformis]|uniref:F-box domain-containing protein n=1 Tax=Mollisia scopiformis TaxID=149040 RepID=A0A194XP13_MOLSC|nr:uncharacterized protein LY89DRAFT_714994 [Mollisia scopiformis]KUJ21985.1 hypothetical protein LY89DRAFT_714994 [Mollisia scopiformis]
MGDTSSVCQLCAVSFRIGRIRTSNESEAHSWDYRASRLFEQDPSQSLCSLAPEDLGCRNITMDRADGVLQHIAGPGCVFEAGYSGCRIGVEEMKGINRARYVVKKPERKGKGEESSKQPQVNDNGISPAGPAHETNGGDDGEWLKDYEQKSEWFLSTSTVTPPEKWQQLSKRAKFGIEGQDICACNFPDYRNFAKGQGYSPDMAMWVGIPVHDACWKIFEKISLRKIGRVDIDGFVALWCREACSNCGFQNLKQDPEIAKLQKLWWVHKPGTEYLVANPVNIPGFGIMMRGTYKEEIPLGDGAFCDRNIHEAMSSNFVEERNRPEDPFYNIPPEIKNDILARLCSKDIASLRLASRCFRQLPKALFRNLIKKEMPWFWEINDVKIEEEEYLSGSFQESYGADMLEVSDDIDADVLAYVQARMEKKTLDTNWLLVYEQLKMLEKGVLGVRNRARIWKVVEEVVDRIGDMAGKNGFKGAVAGVDFPIWPGEKQVPLRCGNSFDQCARCLGVLD